MVLKESGSRSCQLKVHQRIRILILQVKRILTLQVKYEDIRIIQVISRKTDLHISDILAHMEKQ